MSRKTQNWRKWCSSVVLGSVLITSLQERVFACSINPIHRKVRTDCYSRGYAQSSFVITGRGGLPPNPKEILTPDAIQIVDWVSVKSKQKGRSKKEEDRTRSETSLRELCSKHNAYSFTRMGETTAVTHGGNHSLPAIITKATTATPKPIKAKTLDNIQQTQNSPSLPKLPPQRLPPPSELLKPLQAISPSDEQIFKVKQFEFAGNTAFSDEKLTKFF